MKSINNLILDIYDGAQEGTATDLNDHALREFNKMVRFDSAFIIELILVPGREFLVQSLHLQGAPIERFHDRLRMLGPEKIDRNGHLETRDVALKNAFDYRGNSVITNIPESVFDREVLQYCKKYETVHTLTYLSDQVSNGTISAISFGRAAAGQAFDKAGSHAADIVFPHILQARKIHKRTTSNSPTELDDSATVLAYFNGCLNFLDDRAIELIQREWKQWAPPILPPVLIEALSRTKEKIFVGTSIHVKATIQGNMICLVIKGRNVRQAALSHAEYRAAKLAAEGLQYKEIARRLDVSPATVRNQLHSAYGKLGVSNKAALVNALLS